MPMRRKVDVWSSIAEMATLFNAGVRHPRDLSIAMGISERTVRRYSKHNHFGKWLDVLGYQGERELLNKKVGRPKK